MQNKHFQLGDYVVKPFKETRGEVWCIYQNEMIYSDTYEKCVEFVNNITAE